MNAKSYFLNISVTVIILNILLGLSAIFLVERIIPAINQILDDNAYSVSAAVDMMELVAISELKSTDKLEEKFWTSFENAKQNITIKNERALISKIEVQAKTYWTDPSINRAHLTELLSQLAQMNLKDMTLKKSKAEQLGITGSWGLGFLLLISLSLQLVFRSKILSGLIAPLEQILSVVKDFKEGNSLRRFVEQKIYLSDIRRTGVIINSILDQKLLNDKVKKT